MASQQERAPRVQRLLALASVGFLAAVTALAFGRVFIGAAPTWKLLAAGLLSTALAGLLERRSLLLATVVSAVCMLVVVGLFVFPQTTVAGLPSRGTLRAIGEALSQVQRQARAQVAPTPPVAPLLLAALTAIWTAAFSVHSLAVRAGSPLMAALPPAALVGFTDSAVQDGTRPGYAILFLAAVLSVVFVDGIRRIHQWGPVWPWPGRYRRVSAETRGARRVAAVSVVVAALLPGILPGFHAGPLLKLAGGAGSDVRFDPLVSIRAQLTRSKPVDLFSVTSPLPAYWRLLALDEFDGTTFRSSDLDVTRGAILLTPVSLYTGSPPGARAFSATFQILSDLALRWVPMPYPAQEVDLPGGTIRYDPELAAAVDPNNPDGLPAGERYEVSSLAVSPTPADLERVQFLPPSRNPRYTQLPASLPSDIRSIARQWTAGARTPYEQILAIQNRLLDPGRFTYSTDVKPRADSSYLVDFLKKTRTGFCQQFSAAMAVLVRALGYPARVAVGFRSGTLDSKTGQYVVSTEDAHSWVEVLFPGWGWLPFEPTPTRDNPIADSYLHPGSAQGCVRGPCLPGVRLRTSVNQTKLPPRLARLAAIETSQRFTPRDTTREEPKALHVPYGLLVRALLFLVGVALLLLPVAKGSWRRIRLKGKREPRRLVLSTYRVFAEQAWDLGLHRRGGETMDEFQRRLNAAVRFSDGHLGRLTAIATRAAYSAGPVTDEDVREAQAAARTVIREMRKGRGLARRVAGLYRLGT